MKTNQLVYKTIKAGIFAAALFCSASVFAQVKIGTNPTSINAANNLEVEASTTGRKTSIDKTTGQVTIADGTQGAGKLLTSDANGGASWQNNTILRIPETVWIGEQIGSYTVTPWVAPMNAPKDRIPMVSRTGSLPGYDAITKLYTIQENGYYRLHAGTKVVGSLPGGTANPADYVNLYIGFDGSFGVLETFDRPSSNNEPFLAAFWEGYFTAGQTFNVYIMNGSLGSPAQNIVASKTFLSITKLF